VDGTKVMDQQWELEMIQGLLWKCWRQLLWVLHLIRTSSQISRWGVKLPITSLSPFAKERESPTTLDHVG
jgi:hypothetical protein